VGERGNHLDAMHREGCNRCRRRGARRGGPGLGAHAALPDAKSLANRLALQHERNSGNVVDWRIFSPQRQGPHVVVFLYSVEYDNGRVCDAEIVVSFRISTSRAVRARFRDVVCDGP
jgi:hypothetical protein